jgi:hypothetical protein
MPPPPPAGIPSYLTQLHAHSAAIAADAEERRRLRNEIELKKLQLELANLSSPAASTQSKRRPLDFYEQQITAWFNRLPPDARKAPRTMEEFLNLLQGRTLGMRAHAPDVSRVLQRMGWVRKRIWKADGEGRRVWMLGQ